MVTQISWQQAKDLTLEYLYWWMNTIPEYSRAAPRIVFDNYAWSILEVIAAVQADSDLGKRYVSYHINNLGQYIIV